MKTSNHWKLLILLICLAGVAAAQTAREMFNPPAKEYILGNNAAASNLVTQALSKYPDNEQLQKLKELIEQQQQDQQNQDQQNQDQQNQDQQNQDQQNQDQQNQDQQNEDQQNQDQQEQEPQEQEPQKQEPQEAQPSQPQQAGEMSEEEAQQLLDAMKQNEKDQRTDLRPILGQPVRVDKDW